MTCIAAIAHEGDVWIGGDSAGFDEYDLSLGIGAEPKVWTSAPLLFGACGSFRISQLLRWRMTIPTPEPTVDPLSYIVGPVMDAVRSALEEGGALTTWDETHTEEMDAGLIIGYAGRVFEVFTDFGVGELVHRYASVGCGSLIALGVLAATEHLELKPRKRIRLALEAAERHSAGVRGPMAIIRLEAT